MINNKRKYHREYQRRYRAKLRAEKKCVNCRVEIPNKKSKYCDVCLLRERKRNKVGWFKNRKKELERGRAKAHKYRILALTKIAGGTPKCVSCGIDDVRVLCINHIGEKPKEDKKNLTIKVAMSKRGVEGLDIRCFNCNFLYEYEKGRLKLPNKKGGNLLG